MSSWHWKREGWRRTRLDILGGDMSRYQAIALDMDGTPAEPGSQDLVRYPGGPGPGPGPRHQGAAGDGSPLHDGPSLPPRAGPRHPIICSNGAYLYDPVQEDPRRGSPGRGASHHPAGGGAGPADGGAVPPGDGIGYLGCEEHVGRMRRWSATQPDHLKVSPAARRGYRVLVAVPIWKLELFNQDPGRLHPFRRGGGGETALHP